MTTEIFTLANLPEGGTVIVPEGTEFTIINHGSQTVRICSINGRSFVVRPETHDPGRVHTGGGMMRF